MGLNHAKTHMYTAWHLVLNSFFFIHSLVHSGTISQNLQLHVHVHLHNVHVHLYAHVHECWE